MGFINEKRIKLIAEKTLWIISVLIQRSLGRNIQFPILSLFFDSTVLSCKNNL